MSKLSEIEVKRLKFVEFFGLPTHIGNQNTVAEKLTDWVKMLPVTSRIVDIKYTSSNSMQHVLVTYTDDEVT